ncbi:FAD binding domain-containing protein [Mycobacterium sp. MBM]|nr:FAD binding domain-containing protein [Mycobacterium sp. MBM]
MDLNTVEAVHIPTRRDEVWPLGPTDAILAGGTWLFSEPQPAVTRLVDITGLGWPPVTITADGIELAATCTLDEVAALSTTLPPEYPAAPLFGQCATALLASFKIRRTATVGGNICLAFPAGAMTSLCTALDAVATIWRGDGSGYTMPVAELVTGEATNALQPGEMLRSVHVPAGALRARTAFRKLAPSPLGRSGAVVIGRRDEDGHFVLSVTAATVRPYVFRFATAPGPGDLRATLSKIPDHALTRDAHGDPDWRRAVTLTLAEQIRAELA